MPRYFTHYWQNETWEEHRAHGDEGHLPRNIVSNQFIKAGIQPGDVLYEVTVKSGELYVLCRMRVAAVHTRGTTPGKGQSLHGDDVAVADAAGSSPKRFDNQVPGSFTGQLRFITTPEDADNVLQYSPGQLNPMRLRRVRQLTPESAALLDGVIDRYEATHTRPHEDDRESRVGAAPNVWMFQYVPENYDFERYVDTYGVCDFWEVTRNARNMHVGERVYIHRTQGREPAAVVAIGRIVSPVYKSDSGDSHVRVDVLFEMRVVPPLVRNEMKADNILRAYYALEHGLQGTNFLLPPNVADRLDQLASDRLEAFPADKQALSPDAKLDKRTRALVAVVQRQGQPEFRRQLLDAYRGRCAVTGCDALDALEAAHIMAYRGPHTNHITNGLLLRADIHTLFDLGLLTIDGTSMMVLLHPNLAVTTYADLAGTKLRLPENPSSRPSVDSLNEHRSNAGW